MARDININRSAGLLASTEVASIWPSKTPTKSVSNILREIKLDRFNSKANKLASDAKSFSKVPDMISIAPCRKPVLVLFRPDIESSSKEPVSQFSEPTRATVDGLESNVAVVKGELSMMESNVAVKDNVDPITSVETKLVSTLVTLAVTLIS